MFFNNFFLIKTKMLNKFKIKNNIVRNFYVGFIYRPFNFKGRKSCYRVSVKNGKWIKWRWIRLKSKTHYKKIRYVKRIKIRIIKKKTQKYDNVNKISEIIKPIKEPKLIKTPYYSIFYWNLPTQDYLLNSIYTNFFNKYPFIPSSIIHVRDRDMEGDILYRNYRDELKNIYEDLYYNIWISFDYYVGNNNLRDTNSLNYFNDSFINEKNLNSFIWSMVKYETHLAYLMEETIWLKNRELYPNKLLSKLLVHLRVLVLGLTFYVSLTRHLDQLKNKKTKIAFINKKIEKCNYFILNVEKIINESIDYLDKNIIVLRKYIYSYYLSKK